MELPDSNTARICAELGGVIIAAYLFFTLPTMTSQTYGLIGGLAVGWILGQVMTGNRGLVSLNRFDVCGRLSTYIMITSDGEKNAKKSQSYQGDRQRTQCSVPRQFYR
mgnify:FL=1